METREIEYKRITNEKYIILGNGFFIGNIIILDKKDIVFNPSNEDALLDFTIQEMEIIIKIMKIIKNL